MSYDRSGACIVSMICALMLAPLGAAAQTYTVKRIAPVTAKGYEDVHVSKAVAPGQQARVWWATSINPDCSPDGTMTAEILTQPKHGQATLSNAQLYPNFIAPNPRVACDSRKVPGKEAFYTADASFRGHDRMVLRNATSEGRMRRIVVDIDVR